MFCLYIYHPSSQSVATFNKLFQSGCIAIHSKIKSRFEWIVFLSIYCLPRINTALPQAATKTINFELVCFPRSFKPRSAPRNTESYVLFLFSVCLGDLGGFNVFILVGAAGIAVRSSCLFFAKFQSPLDSTWNQNHYLATFLSH